MDRRTAIKMSVGMTAGGILVPTPSSGDDLGNYGKYHKFDPPVKAQVFQQPRQVPRNQRPTEDNILGPFHRDDAPMRGKVSPPFAEGILLLVKGTVYGADTGKPLSLAWLDIWQADTHGRYDNDQDKDPPFSKQPFVNRCRMFTDEQGKYEFETIHPGAYKIDGTTWRPSHIHYWVQHTSYLGLITQLYFAGDKYNATDRWIKQSLIMPVASAKVGRNSYEVVTFDIVLAKKPLARS